MPVSEGGVILPGSVEGVRPRNELSCNVCGESFPRQHKASYESHVSRCAQENIDMLRAMSPRAKAPGIFGDVGVDTELRDYLRAGGSI